MRSGLGHRWARRLGKGKRFIQLDVPGSGAPAAADGIRSDVDGNIWAGALPGVQVIAPNGDRIGMIRLPRDTPTSALAAWPQSPLHGLQPVALRRLRQYFREGTSREPAAVSWNLRLSCRPSLERAPQRAVVIMCDGFGLEDIWSRAGCPCSPAPVAARRNFPPCSSHDAVGDQHQQCLHLLRHGRTACMASPAIAISMSRAGAKPTWRRPIFCWPRRCSSAPKSAMAVRSAFVQEEDDHPTFFQ